MYLTVVALAAILMMSINLNANMNSKMNAYATIMSEIQGADDIGQSLECVIVVVGCDGTGSVGSSGDTIIGSNNGNNDTNGETPVDPDTPLPPEPTNCAECIEALGEDVLVDLRVALSLPVAATAAEICAALDALATVGAVISLLNGADISVDVIVDVLACLGVDITVAQVLAIIAGLEL